MSFVGPAIGIAEWIFGLIGLGAVAHETLPGKEEREQTAGNLLSGGSAADDATLMSQAQDQANDGTGAQSETDTATTACTGDCPPSRECEEAAGKVKEALYKNKRDPNVSEGHFGTGFHGYMNRMVEQICGAQGPGSRSWIEHEKHLAGARRKLREGMMEVEKNQCNKDQLFSRSERDAINNIRSGKVGWTPAQIIWKGPGHSDCLNVSRAMSQNRMRDYLNVIRRP